MNLFRIVPMLTTVTVLSILSSCTDSSMGSESISARAQPLSFSYKMEWPAKIDEVNKTLIQGDVECGAGGGLDTVFEEEDRKRYQITNGKLMMWWYGGCDAKVFSGNSTSIYGTWTPELTEILAPGYSGECEELDTLNPEEDYPSSYTFRQNSYSITYQVNRFCWAEDEIQNFEYEEYEDVASTELIDCSKFDVTLTNGQKATWTLNEVNPAELAIVYSVTLNGVTCTRNDKSYDLTPEICSQAWANYQAAEPGGVSDYYAEKYYEDQDHANFRACLIGAGIPEAIMKDL